VTRDAAAKPSAPCPVQDKQDLDGALDEAARRFEAGEHLVALACAEQAAHIAPRSVEAHHDRADALVALERIDDARAAFALALALDPEDPQTLASAADFYVNRLGGEHEQLLIGLEYARRGSAHAGRRREDREQAARLALLEAEALDDLGRSDEALPRVEAALRMTPDNPEARYLRALVLFHLCKLERARQAFEQAARGAPGRRVRHHHLGLILERDGRYAEAELHFARARALAPSAVRRGGAADLGGVRGHGRGRGGDARSGGQEPLGTVQLGARRSAGARTISWPASRRSRRPSSACSARPARPVRMPAGTEPR
jgi:tetratricopeptide (TPR) repeat protein